MSLIEGILQETDWLYVKLFQIDVVFFDLWSVVYFWIGFSMIILLHALNIRRALLFQVLILIAYAVVKILILYFVFSIFIPDSIKDRFADIFVGIAGGVLSEWIWQWVRKNQQKHAGIIETGQAIYIAFTYSFIWVGFYRYHYNLPGFNSAGINYAALIFWFLGSLSVLLGFLWLRRRGIIVGVLSTWGIYLLILGILEYISYYDVGLHEISKPDSKPMVCGIIHGLPILHIFYMIAPGILILMFSLLNRICSNALRSRHRHIIIFPDLRDQSL